MFTDEFTDPVDVRQTFDFARNEISSRFYYMTELYGAAYKITDRWAAMFDANILLDASGSLYGS